MNQNLIYLVGAGHYDVLRDYSRESKESAIAVSEAFAIYGPDDFNIFDMFAAIDKYVLHLLTRYNKINILRHLTAKGQSVGEWLWLEANGYGHRILAMFLYELVHYDVGCICHHNWFIKFIASRESYRSRAMLVLYAMRGNKRDVGRMIARVIWENRAHSADEYLDSRRIDETI